MSNSITNIVIYVCLYACEYVCMYVCILCMYVQTQFAMVRGTAGYWRKTQYCKFDRFSFKLINVIIIISLLLSHWSRCCEWLWQTWTLADLQSSQCASSPLAPGWRCSWWRKETHTCDISHCVHAARRLPPCLHPLRPTLDLLPPQLKNFALSPHIKSA